MSGGCTWASARTGQSNGSSGQILKSIVSWDHNSLRNRVGFAILLQSSSRRGNQSPRRNQARKYFETIVVYAENMDVHLTAEQADFIRHVVESGRFANVEDAVREAVLLLERREQEIVELRGLLDEGIADLDNKNCFDYTDETLPGMIDDIRRDARESHAPDPKIK